MTKRALNSQMNTVGHCHTDLAEVKSSETRPLNINLTDTLFILQSVFKSTSRAALQERKLYRSTRPAETFFGYQREGIRSQSHQRFQRLLPLFLSKKTLFIHFVLSQLPRACKIWPTCIIVKVTTTKLRPSTRKPSPWKSMALAGSTQVCLWLSESPPPTTLLTSSFFVRYCGLASIFGVSLYHTRKVWASRVALWEGSQYSWAVLRQGASIGGTKQEQSCMDLLQAGQVQGSREAV